MDPRNRRTLRARRAALAALAFLAFAPPAGAIPGPRGALPPPVPALETPVNVDELVARHGRPDLYASGRAECLAYVAESAREPLVVWFVFPRRGDTGRPRVLLGLGREELASVEGACGPDAARFAAIVHATCVAPPTLFELLRAPELLGWRSPPLPASLQWAPFRQRDRLGGGAPVVGCARIVDARDGSARLWVPLRERLAAQDAAAGTGVLRGLAFLQVRGAGGEVRVFRDRAREDLHLDSVVDALEPLPGPSPRYLVVGARTFDAPAPGALPRRYAFVMEVDAEGPHVLPGQFAFQDERRDLLLLQGAEPPGGDFRLHALRARHLAYAPKDGTLWLAASGPARLAGERGADARRALVAVRQDGVFRLAAARWNATAERPGDARIWLSERWGSVDEVGQRGFEEILEATPSTAGASREPGDGPVAVR